MQDWEEDSHFLSLYKLREIQSLKYIYFSGVIPQTIQHLMKKSIKGKPASKGCLCMSHLIRIAKGFVIVCHERLKMVINILIVMI